MFRFKQFSVDQTGCAMKINTDGVLLGALVEADDPKSILDIGTGTGVIALMLAQRFPSVQIDAVEIDRSAAQTAGDNFANSPFADRMTIFSTDFQSYFKDNPSKKYDTIISNPPFHLNSLKSPKATKALAKHTGDVFFEELMEYAVKHLTYNGVLWLILPLQASELVKELAKQVGFHLQKEIEVYSFSHSEPHRMIICFGFDMITDATRKLVIYDAVNSYSKEYAKLLQPYFIAF